VVRPSVRGARRSACPPAAIANLCGRVFGSGWLRAMATALYLRLVISQHRRSITSSENRLSETIGESFFTASHSTQARYIMPSRLFWLSHSCLNVWTYFVNSSSSIQRRTDARLDCYLFTQTALWHFNGVALGRDARWAHTWSRQNLRFRPSRYGRPT